MASATKTLMRARFTIFFLAFAVLFSSVHVTSWPHDHDDNSVLSHATSEATHHDAGDGHAPDQANSPDAADVSGGVAHHHSYPVGIEVSALELDPVSTRYRAIIPKSPATALASLNRAPPTEPPSA